ncbi:hypothetical protein EVAR_79699_1 [Eumeta japonica]|uniref:Uncharacterized protein n=1 Tax=Eumeta variegata TaxID=151549 RepID=A0A4C1TCI7_EUMVA|nr:hypothetical protein EVAR_79699_1 [Eumeta japonica]
MRQLLKESVCRKYNDHALMLSRTVKSRDARSDLGPMGIGVSKCFNNDLITTIGADDDDNKDNSLLKTGEDAEGCVKAGHQTGLFNHHITIICINIELKIAPDIEDYYKVIVQRAAQAASILTRLRARWRARRRGPRARFTSSRQPARRRLRTYNRFLCREETQGHGGYRAGCARAAGHSATFTVHSDAAGAAV